MPKASKQHFTKALLDALALPEKGKRITVYDDLVRGLCLIQTDTGSKSFYVLRKVRGRAERVMLGRYPETTIAQARKRAQETNSLVDAGENPNDLRREQRKEMTVSQLFQSYYEKHSLAHNKRPEETLFKFDRYIVERFGSRYLSELNRRDITAWHLEMGKKYGPQAANKAHSLLRAMLNKAIGWDLIDANNPASRIERFRSKSRDRFITQHEMPRFVAALKEEPNEIIRDYLFVLLLTGARRREASTMRWVDLDLDSGIWKIPDTKNGESRRVVLVGQSLAILRRRKDQSKSAWVFPGTGRTGHLEEPKKAWSRILAKAEITDLRLHDLRRTHGSWMAAGGTSLHIIGKALGHKDVATTMIYARLDLDPVRTAVQSAADAMFPFDPLAKSSS